jgi:site-specific DNA-methyltransferase (adenine-specific)
MQLHYLIINTLQIKSIAYTSVGGGYCNPMSYESAKTVYYQPMNVKDKNLYEHPTIKPLNIIENLVENSSKEKDVILDPFMGSGTTGVACQLHNRSFIGFEIEKHFFEIAENRIKETVCEDYEQGFLFEDLAE